MHKYSYSYIFRRVNMSPQACTKKNDVWCGNGNTKPKQFEICIEVTCSINKRATDLIKVMKEDTVTCPNFIILHRNKNTLMINTNFGPKGVYIREVPLYSTVPYRPFRTSLHEWQIHPPFSVVSAQLWFTTCTGMYIGYLQLPVSSLRLL